jgi:hypothetical protein
VGRDRNRPDARIRLGWTDQELPLQPDDGLADVDDAGVEVEIADPEPTDFTRTKAALAGQEQRHPSRLWYGGHIAVQLIDSEQSISRARCF